MFTAFLLAFTAVPNLSAKLEFPVTAISEKAELGAEKYPFVFTFENAGDQTVKITDVKTSCGCTTTDLDKKVYQPGEKGEIKGNFKIGDRQGVQRKSITIKTNDLGQPEIKLELMVEIPQPLSLKPGLLFWRLGSDPDAKVIEVESNEEFGIEIVSVESASEDFNVQLVKPSSSAGTVSTDGKGCEISVSPVSTAEAKRVLIKIAAANAQGFKRTYYAHALVR
ncbi:DUF1573 domain-containing protein [Cerasicoccus arenae]|uniref:DUF1573 domain-containing protein n=1 Tax=Cerasicoccus arenae TaxID=424488 RepID=UPI001A2F90AD|nr:DUF1573 domain-containing protein [Cerasicoccus arenae]MBK1857842.1 DUF1573 domain-containing protein [Cerasicoccus arenae]